MNIPKACCMCINIIYSNTNENDVCRYCWRRIMHMAGNYQLGNGLPYRRDDNSRKIPYKHLITE